MEKLLFFWVATAGLGIYHTGSYGCIRVDTEYAGLPYFDRAAVIANGKW